MMSETSMEEGESAGDFPTRRERATSNYPLPEITEDVEDDVKIHTDLVILHPFVRLARSISPKHRFLILFFLALSLSAIILVATGVLEPQRASLSLEIPITSSHSNPPVYVSMVTLSLDEGVRGSSKRMESLSQFAKVFSPDFLALQSLTSETLDVLDETMGRTHNRVKFSQDPEEVDESSNNAWESQGNIYYNGAVWTLEQHGAQEFGKDPHTGKPIHVLWMRCRATSAVGGLGNTTVLVAVAKLTAEGSLDELRSNANIRKEQADAIWGILYKVHTDRAEPLVLLGDMGDGYSAQQVFEKPGVGLRDPFSSLNLQLDVTYPNAATKIDKGIVRSPCTRDWAFSNDRVRPVYAAVVRYRYEDYAPSIHWPVQVVYELLPCTDACQGARAAIASGWTKPSPSVSTPPPTSIRS